MQFFLIDAGTAVAVLLGYLGVVAVKRRQELAVARRPAASAAELHPARKHAA